MLKKTILVVATLAVIGVAFQIYQSQDDQITTVRDVDPDVPAAVTENRTPTTSPASDGGSAAKGFEWRDARIPAGKRPVFRMYGPDGEAKIIFRATEWQPISDNEFEMTDPVAQVLLPSGQLARLRADEGRVTVQKGNSSNYNPKRGWFRGNVSIFIDLTKPEWRKANPDRADPEQHPESVVRIWLDDARFDLDLTRLESDGPIQLESARGMVKGRGLTLIWNEIDRRIKYLSIHEGERATLRSVDFVRLTSPENDEGEAGASLDSQDAPPSASPTRSAVAASPEPPAVPAARPEVRHELSLIELEDVEDQPREEKIDTYRITFQDNVVASEHDGPRVAGRLWANVIELLVDFGQAERDALETSPSEQAEEAPDEQEESPPTVLPQTTVDLRWSGRLEVVPVEEDVVRAPDEPRRLRLVARGSPLRLEDAESGNVTCLEMEYQADEEQIWLRGSDDQPVILETGVDGQRLEGRVVFVDQRNGIARFEGPGRLVAQEGSWDAAETRVDFGLGGKADADPEMTSIAWSRGMEIAFGVEENAPSTPAPTAAIPKGTYIKKAVFDGDVVISESDQVIEAGHVEATFRAPEKAADSGQSSRSMSAERIVATDGVRMRRMSPDKVEHVTCDRLEVDVRQDDTGSDYPAVARAIGHASAWQVSRSPSGAIPANRSADRQIHAQEELVLEMASVPRPVTDAERKRLEAIAAELRIEPGSPAWVSVEQDLRRRRDLVTTRMTAVGSVDVRDVEQELDLRSSRLTCTFGSQEQIEWALIDGRDDEPAQVDLGDFFIRGPKISLDLKTQSAEVPGAGLLRFMTKQDLDGRPVEEPIPVVVTWDERMVLRGDQNRGRFSGSARAVSEDLTLDCNELQLRFVDLPRPAPVEEVTRPQGPDPRWIVGPLADSIWGSRAPSAAERTSQGLRKRLAHLYAVGDAVIQSAVHEDPRVRRRSQLDKWLDEVWPSFVERSTSTESSGSPRLTSRLRLAGPRITIDLDHEHLAVEGAGNLLIEDYRFRDKPDRSDDDNTGSGVLSGTSLTSLQGLGPSQTVFEWQNSMMFLNNRNVAVFEDSVDMTHRAGSKMVQLERLAAAMDVTREQLMQLTPREASLTCNNLLVEFERTAEQPQTEASPLSRATNLRRFQATGRVRLEENKRGVVGVQVSYDSQSGTGRVLGSSRLPAQLFMLNPRTGEARTVSVRDFTWDQNTGVITAGQPTILDAGNQ